MHTLQNSQNSLILMFNAHLPYVKRHKDEQGKLAARWLFDALVWSYIPFIEMVKNLSNKNLNFSIGLSLSTTLLAMLQDEFVMQEFEEYLEDSIILGEKEHIRLKNSNNKESDLCIDMANRYRDHYITIKELYYKDYERDIIAQWKYLESLKTVELCTTSGTYAFLPNFRNSKETIRCQIKNGLQSFQHIMKTAPVGFLLPECGYYEGIEDELQLYGVKYSFCDVQAFLFANKVPSYGIFNPVYSNGKNVLFFPRDRVLSDMIWSIQDGYMSQNSYRDFNKDIGDDVSLDYLSSTTHIKHVRMMTGYKYYAINNEEKETIYNPMLAQQQVTQDIDDYIEKVTTRFHKINKLSINNPVSTQIFNLDLFGQRWYEGFDWLRGILDKIISLPSIEVSSPSAYLKRNTNIEYESINLSFSSWSEKGYAQVWVGDKNKLLNRDIHRCIELFKKLVQRAPYETKEIRNLFDRIIQQAGRELLLAQSSDWPFILHANKFTNFVNREVQVHLKNFNILYHMLISKEIDFSFVHKLEQQNKIFNDFDYSMFESSHTSTES